MSTVGPEPKPAQPTAPTTDRRGRTLLALCIGLAIAGGTIGLGGPLLHYIPASATWTWHPPEGVVTMGYYGLLLNAAAGGLIGWLIGGWRPVRHWTVSPRARRRLARVAGAMVCVTLTLAVAHEATGPRSEHDVTKKSLRVGDTIPPFSLQSATGETVTREDLLGKGPVVIYFYPRDETPGCTAQACSFRDSYEVFTDAGAEVVGVSSDTAESHRAFAEHHRLPFVLLADPKSALRRAFGVPKTLGLMQGRVTYVADREGVIRHVFDSQLLVNQHVTEALATVQALTAN